ncbi:MAG: helix-turn-helix domain-containing protein [Sphingorhabdus sp.]
MNAPRTDYRSSQLAKMFQPVEPSHSLENLIRKVVTEELAKRDAQATTTERKYRPTVRHCIELSAIEFKVEIMDIFSKRRQQPLAIARQTAMWLARKVTILSYPDIGRHFVRDHQTVLHGVQAVENRRKTDHDFRQKTDRMLSLFEAEE